MAFSLIANAKGTGVSGAITNAVDTTGANLIILTVGWYHAITADVTITDSKSNTWNALTKKSTTTISNRIWWSIPTSVGSSHTFTQTSATSFGPIIMTAWSGSHASAPADQENGAVSSSASSLATGSITPSENNCLVIAGIGHENNTSVAATINGSFTISDEVLYSGGASESAAMAYLIQTTATAANPTWSITNACEMAVTIASFKTPAAGGVTVKLLAALGVG